MSQQLIILSPVMTVTSVQRLRDRVLRKLGFTLAMALDQIHSASKAVFD